MTSVHIEAQVIQRLFRILLTPDMLISGVILDLTVRLSHYIVIKYFTTDVQTMLIFPGHVTSFSLLELGSCPESFMFSVLPM